MLTSLPGLTMMSTPICEINALIDFMSLQERIQEAMDAAEMSAADLARATKCSRAAVTHWLNGDTRSLKAETAELIEQATGYSSSWLVTGKGPKKSGEPRPPHIPVDVSYLSKILDSVAPELRQEAYLAASQTLIGFLGRGVPASSELEARSQQAKPSD